MFSTFPCAWKVRKKEESRAAERAGGATGTARATVGAHPGVALRSTCGGCMRGAHPGHRSGAQHPRGALCPAPGGHRSGAHAGGYRTRSGPGHRVGPLSPQALRGATAPQTKWGWGGVGPRLRSTHYPRVNVVRGVKRRVSLQQGAANVRLQRLIRTDAPRNRLTHLGDESCLCKLWLVLHSVCDFCGGSCLLGSGVGLLLLVGKHLSHPGFVLHRQTCHDQSAKCVARVSRQDCWRRGAGPLVHLLALSSCTPTQEVG